MVCYVPGEPIIIHILYNILDIRESKLYFKIFSVVTVVHAWLLIVDYALHVMPCGLHLGKYLVSFYAGIFKPTSINDNNGWPGTLTDCKNQALTIQNETNTYFKDLSRRRENVIVCFFCKIMVLKMNMGENNDSKLVLH